MRSSKLKVQKSKKDNKKSVVTLSGIRLRMIVCDFLRIEPDDEKTFAH